MLAILHLLVMFVADIFKSRRRVEAENLFLRHQLNIALRQAPPRLRLRGSDRALLVWLTRLWPSLIDAAQVAQPETILRWHRAGWKAFWRWRARKLAGRPKIDRGLRDLIGSIPYPMQSLCTLRAHCRQWARNTRYQAGAAPYLGRTSTGWIAPACGWRTHSTTSKAGQGDGD